MYQYPKQILTITQQVQSYIDAGMTITSRGDVEKALKSIGEIARLTGRSRGLPPTPSSYTHPARSPRIS